MRKEPCVFKELKRDKKAEDYGMRGRVASTEDREECLGGKSVECPT